MFPIVYKLSITGTLTNQNGQRKHKVLFTNVILIQYLQNTLSEIQQSCTLKILTYTIMQIQFIIMYKINLTQQF